MAQSESGVVSNVINIELLVHESAIVGDITIDAHSPETASSAMFSISGYNGGTVIPVSDMGFYLSVYTPTAYQYLSEDAMAGDLWIVTNFTNLDGDTRLKVTYSVTNTGLSPQTFVLRVYGALYIKYSHRSLSSELLGGGTGWRARPIDWLELGFELIARNCPDVTDVDTFYFGDWFSSFYGLTQTQQAVNTSSSMVEFGWNRTLSAGASIDLSVVFQFDNHRTAPVLQLTSMTRSGSSVRIEGTTTTSSPSVRVVGLLNGNVNLSSIQTVFDGGSGSFTGNVNLSIWQHIDSTPLIYFYAVDLFGTASSPVIVRALDPPNLATPPPSRSPTPTPVPYPAILFPEIATFIVTQNNMSSSRGYFVTVKVGNQMAEMAKWGLTVDGVRFTVAVGANSDRETLIGFDI
jgi:hypothetical protein